LEDEAVGLVSLTEPSALRAELDRAVAADPVRNTMLATIRDALSAGGWGAVDGAALAARSSPQLPVALTDGWTDVPALAAALAGLDALTSVGGPVPTVDELAARLDRAVVARTAERLFRCDEVHPPSGVAGRARLATAADADLLTAWRGPYYVDVFGRIPPGADLAGWPALALAGLGTFLWLDAAGEPVAQACARTPIAGVARIGPVYTPPEHRGHGYGSAVTAAATRAVLAAGAIPVLYTDLANPTSNKIYQAIGYRPVTDRAAVWFA
jgi:GNAT superfamily N-acetyltransferase